MLRNVTIMTTSTNSTVIGHVVYTEGRTPSVKVGPYGSLVITLDAPVPCIVGDKTLETKELNLAKAVVARAAHMKYTGLDAYLKAMDAKARAKVKEHNKNAAATGLPVKDADVTAAAVISVCWSKIYAFSNLTITPVEYVAGEELGAGIVAQKGGYRYDVSDIEITDAELLAAINPLDDDLLVALGL